jgi:hypothetical protein
MSNHRPNPDSASLEGNYAVIGYSEDGRLYHDGIGWIDADVSDFIHYFNNPDEACTVAREEEQKQKNLGRGRWLFRIKVLTSKM